MKNYQKAFVLALTLSIHSPVIHAQTKAPCEDEQPTPKSGFLFEGGPNDSVTCEGVELDSHSDSIKVKRINSGDSIKYEIYQDGERSEICKSKPAFNVYQYDNGEFVNFDLLSKVTDAHLFDLFAQQKVGSCELKMASSTDYSVVTLKKKNTEKRKTLGTFYDLNLLTPDQMKGLNIYQINYLNVVSYKYQYTRSYTTAARDSIEAKHLLALSGIKQDSSNRGFENPVFIGTVDPQSSEYSTKLLTLAEKIKIAQFLRKQIAIGKCGVISSDVKDSKLQEEVNLLRGYPETLLKKHVSTARLIEFGHSAQSTLLPNGYNAKKMTELGYDIDELAELGYNSLQLVEAGATLEMLAQMHQKNSSIDPQDPGVLDALIRSGQTYTKLKSVYSPALLATKGFLTDAIKDGLKIADYALTAQDADYSTVHLKTLGFNAEDIFKYQVSLAGSGNASVSNDKAAHLEQLVAEYGTEKLRSHDSMYNYVIYYGKKAAAKVFFGGDMNKLISSLKSDGFTIAYLQRAGFLSTEILAAGVYSVTDLYEEGVITIAGLIRENKTTDEILKLIPCARFKFNDVAYFGQFANEGKCKKSDFAPMLKYNRKTSDQWQESHLRHSLKLNKETFRSWYPNPTELLGYPVNMIDHDVVALKHYSTRELVEAGFRLSVLAVNKVEITIQDLLSWGYTPEDLYQVKRWTVASQLVAGGISIKDLRTKTSLGNLAPILFIRDVLYSRKTYDGLGSNLNHTLSQFLESGIGRKDIITYFKIYDFSRLKQVRSELSKIRAQKYRKTGLPQVSTKPTLDLKRSGKKLVG